ncbi:Transporter, MFS superfamily [Bifidobacterium dolichotidis]|uniref:Transporter, MFS superfamily n=1 Tax=Bifidobacterium dolichotidis TaxID=2306976 RepID=A0A430FS96_9BIFI|nr:MFS transporter [Bifidobacterium dolichotidis]RSX55729.1 Transporter, MFS superfamily [Bifidobacterium dolichotidis]
MSSFTPNTAAAGHNATLTRNERLDRLKLNAAHRRLLVASGVGWAFDAMDVGLVSFVVTAIAADPVFHLTATQKSWVLSIGFIGMAIGAALGGYLADRFGRKTIFTATLIVFGIANGAMAFAWSLVALLAARFVIGLGLGAELPVASTLVSEFSPTRQRGRMTVLLESFWAVGWIIAALIGYFVIPFSGDWGWRWALLIGAVPLLYAIVVRRQLPESVRFLESRGRQIEAEQAVRYFELAGDTKRLMLAKAEAALSVSAAGPQSDLHETKPMPRIRTRELFSRKFLGITAAIWATWFFVNFSYYGAFTWMPSLLADQFGSLTKSFGYTLAISIAQLPGYFLAAWLVERWGRRRTLAVFLGVSAVAAFLFSQSTAVWQVLVFGCLLSASNLGAWGVMYAVTPEIYPTRLRGAASGAAAACGRVAAIIAPLLMPWFLTLSGGNKSVAFIVFAVAFVLACVAALFLPERTGQELED